MKLQNDNLRFRPSLVQRLFSCRRTRVFLQDTCECLRAGSKDAVALALNDYVSEADLSFALACERNHCSDRLLMLKKELGRASPKGNTLPLLSERA